MSDELSYYGSATISVVDVIEGHLAEVRRKVTDRFRAANLAAIDLGRKKGPMYTTEEHAEASGALLEAEAAFEKTLAHELRVLERALIEAGVQVVFDGWTCDQKESEPDPR